MDRNFALMDGRWMFVSVMVIVCCVAANQWVYGQVAASAPVASGVTISGPKPVITCDEPVHDFGTVWAQTSQRLQHKFVIKNTGDATLEISQVRPSCGCTTAGAYPKSLKPGESGEFPFALEVGQLHGMFAKSISVTSNDPARQQITLTLKGTVKRYVEVTPVGAYFGAVFGGEPQSRVLKIVSNAEVPLKLSLDPFLIDNGPFRFELVETKPGKEFDLKVTAMLPFKEPGMKQTIAKLLTNIEQQREVSVTASVMVRDRLDIQPPTMMIYPMGNSNPPAAGNRTSRILRFTNYGKDPVQVLETTSDEPEFKLTIRQQEAGKIYDINVDMPANYTVPNGGRKITVMTSDKEKPSLTVPVAGPVTMQPASHPANPISSMPTPRPAEKMVGQQAPAFSLTTVAGKQIGGDELKGSITVLDFISSRCGFCKKQMPRLETLRATYEPKGVRFYLIGETMGKMPETTEVVTPVLKQINVKMDLAIDPDNKVGQSFEARSYPTMMIVGKSGKIEVANIGNKADLEEAVKAQLDALIDGKPVPDKYMPPK